jgi:alpha,alpha-trehalase
MVVASTVCSFIASARLNTYEHPPDLDRSQPPVFTRMLADYVAASNDTSILKRGLALAEAELKWWDTNRTVSVKSAFTNQTYRVHQYSVNNSAPRPESYFQDYTTANSPDLPALNETQRAALYAELASGAESGQSFSALFFHIPCY